MRSRLRQKMPTLTLLLSTRLRNAVLRICVVDQLSEMPEVKILRCGSRSLATTRKR